MKLTTTLEELLAFAKNGNAEEVAEFRKQLMESLKAFLNHPELGEVLNKMAYDRAEEQMRRVMENAVHINKSGWGSTEKRTLEGWAIELLKDTVKGQIDHMTFDLLIRKAVKAESEIWRSDVQQLEERVKTLTDEEVRRLIPQYVTAEYRERVASHLHESLFEEMVTEAVQKVVGRLLSGGAQA